VVLVGCGEEPFRFFPLPETVTDDRGAFILANVADGAIERWEVYDEISRPTIRWPDRGAGTLELVSYARSVSRLRLEEGPLPLGLKADERVTQGVPEGGEVFVLDLGAETPSWARTPTISAALASAVLPDVLKSCDIEATSAANLDTVEPALYAVPVPGGGAIIGTEDLRVFFVDRVDGEAITREITPATGELFTTATNVNGRIFMATNFGAIHEVSFDGSDLTVGERVATGSFQSFWMDAGPTGAGELEFFTLGRNGELSRGTDERANVREELHVFDRSSSSNLALAGLTRVGPGHVLAGVERQGEVLRYRNGQVSFEPFGDSLEGLGDVLHTSEGNTYLSTTAGKIYRDDGGGRWSQLDIGLSEIWVPGLAEYPGGFVYVAAFGNGGFFVEGLGECPLAGPELIGAITYWMVVPIGGGTYVASGLASEGERLAITFFDPVTAAE
jgi:hypothetical protein